MAVIDIYRQSHSESRKDQRRSYSMSSSINLSVTDNYASSLTGIAGMGHFFATPSELLCDLLREKKERMEAAEMRDAILEGYRDLIGTRAPIQGDPRATLREAQRREKQG